MAPAVAVVDEVGVETEAGTGEDLQAVVGASGDDEPTVFVAALTLAVVFAVVLAPAPETVEVAESRETKADDEGRTGAGPGR